MGLRIKIAKRNSEVVLKLDGRCQDFAAGGSGSGSRQFS